METILGTSTYIVLRDSFLIVTSLAALFGLVFWWGWLLKNFEYSPDAHKNSHISSNNWSMSFKQELQAMPPMQRWTIYLCLACTVLLFIQCIFVMPAILGLYGWGYQGGYVF
jgi:hypothetical protein